MLLAILLLALLGKASDILLSRVERRVIGTRL
jgi:ABC-type nitrate/sulfonate/bicarbonate transport system permease component